MFCNKVSCILATTFMAVAASGQNPNANLVHVLTQPDQTVTYISGADVTAMIARAKSESKGDSTMVTGDLLKLAPYTVLLEYRPAGKDVKVPAGTHPKEAELFYVLDGAGTLITGGTLAADHLSVDGGQSQKIGKGDILFVPEGTPPWFTQVEKTLQLMSVHVPRQTTAHASNAGQ